MEVKDKMASNELTPLQAQILNVFEGLAHGRPAPAAPVSFIWVPGPIVHAELYDLDGVKYVAALVDGSIRKLLQLKLLETETTEMFDVFSDCPNRYARSDGRVVSYEWANNDFVFFARLDNELVYEEEVSPISLSIESYGITQAGFDALQWFEDSPPPRLVVIGAQLEAVLDGETYPLSRRRTEVLTQLAKRPNEWMTTDKLKSTPNSTPYKTINELPDPILQLIERDSTKGVRLRLPKKQVKCL